MALDEAGLEDSAILLMSLGEEEAAAVFSHLSPREVQSLGETIARMTSVPKERLDEVLAKFTSTAQGRSPLVADTGNYVRNVLNKALDEDKANLLIDRILQNGDVSGIEGLKWMDARVDRRDAAPRAPADRRRRPRPPRSRPGRGRAQDLRRAAAQRGARPHRHARRHPAVGAEGPERGDGPAWSAAASSRAWRRSAASRPRPR